MKELKKKPYTILKTSEDKTNKHLSLLFKHARKSKPMILDGAIGSQLINKRRRAHPVLWSSIFNLTHPQKVFELHNKYISAGADIITTNTFRTNPIAVKESLLKLNPKKFVKDSVQLAIDAAKGKKVLVAGSNAPAEDCYQSERKISHKELERNHAEHISNLFECGVDFVLNETQSHLDEIKFISNYCDKENIPFVMSIFFNRDLKILSGEKLIDVLRMCGDSNAIAVGLNCITFDVFEKMNKSLLQDFNWGFYLNCGDGNYNTEFIECEISPQKYITQIKNHIAFKPSFIGACCGSSPKHISQLKNYFYGSN